MDIEKIEKAIDLLMESIGYDLYCNHCEDWYKSKDHFEEWHTTPNK